MLSLKLQQNFMFFRTEKTVIGCTGFHGDCLTLTKIIEARLKVTTYLSVFNNLDS